MLKHLCMRIPVCTYSYDCIYMHEMLCLRDARYARVCPYASIETSPYIYMYIIEQETRIDRKVEVVWSALVSCAARRYIAPYSPKTTAVLLKVKGLSRYQQIRRKSRSAVSRAPPPVRPTSCGRIKCAARSKRRIQRIIPHLRCLP